MDMAKLFPNHFLILLAGLVAMKARTTVRVLANTEETAPVKVMANKVCRRMQDSFLGCPMNRNVQRKQHSREKSRAQVMFQLLALTMGVFLC